MSFVRKVISHLFLLFENAKISNEVIIGITVLIAFAALTAAYILIRTYIKSYISAIINEELKRNPTCIRNAERIENLMKECDELNDAFDKAFPRTLFGVQQDREPAIIYGPKDQVINDSRKSPATFDREKGEVIFRVKLKDLITSEKIIEEEGDHDGKNCDSR